MPQFSIRQLLVGTTYIAVGCAVSATLGFEIFLWFNLVLLHIAVIAIASVGAFEYVGHRRRFCLASLVTLCGFLAWVFWSHFNVVAHNIFLLIGLAVAYFAGIIAASAYRAIYGVAYADDAGRIVTAFSHLLSKLLPSSGRHQEEG